MLRLSTKRLRVHLFATHVRICVVGGVLRERELTTIDLPVSSLEGAPAWKAPLETVNDWLAEAKEVYAGIHFIVGAALTRYLLIEWNQQISGKQELASLAQAKFDFQYGDSNDSWALQFDQSGFERNGICAGMEVALVREVRQLCVKCRLRLLSLQPSLMYVFNRWRKRIGKDALLVSVEENRCVLASITNGGWNSVRAVTVQPNALDTALKRELLLLGLPDASPVFVYARGTVACSAGELVSRAVVRDMELLQRSGEAQHARA